MPELPEVETIARGLAKRITGDGIESVWLGETPDPLKPPAPQMAGVLEHSRIATVRRMGKHIVFDLDRVGRTLLSVRTVPAKKLKHGIRTKRAPQTPKGLASSAAQAKADEG